MTWHAQLPPEDFYWGVFDARDVHAPPWARTKRTTQLGYLFEDLLPLPIEDIHAIYTHLGDGRVLACGMECDRLRELASVRRAVTPAEIPPDLGVASVIAAQLNLLRRPFMSEAVRRAERQLVLAMCSVLLVVALLAFVGLERRAAQERAIARQAKQRVEALFDAHIPPSTVGGQPSAVRFVSMLRELRRTHAAPTDAAALADATPSLSRLLAAWPTDLEIRTESLLVGADSVVLTVELPDAATAETFRESITRDGVWMMTQDNLTRSREGLRLRLRLEPKP